MKNLILISILGLFFFTSCSLPESTFADQPVYEQYNFADRAKYEHYNFVDEDMEWYIDDIYSPIYRDPFWSLYFDKQKLLNYIQFWNNSKY